MKFRARKTFRFGPLYFNFTHRGFSSWGIRIGPITHNFTRKTSTIDTPGPGGFHHQHGRNRSK